MSQHKFTIASIKSFCKCKLHIHKMCSYLCTVWIKIRLLLFYRIWCYRKIISFHVFNAFYTTFIFLNKQTLWNSIMSAAWKYFIQAISHASITMQKGLSLISYFISSFWPIIINNTTLSHQSYFITLRCSWYYNLISQSSMFYCYSASSSGSSATSHVLSIYLQMHMLLYLCCVVRLYDSSCRMCMCIYSYEFWRQSWLSRISNGWMIRCTFRNASKLVYAFYVYCCVIKRYPVIVIVGICLSIINIILSMCLCLRFAKLLIELSYYVLGSVNR